VAPTDHKYLSYPESKTYTHENQELQVEIIHITLIFDGYGYSEHKMQYIIILEVRRNNPKCSEEQKGYDNTLILTIAASSRKSIIIYELCSGL